MSYCGGCGAWDDPVEHARAHIAKGTEPMDVQSLRAMVRLLRGGVRATELFRGSDDRYRLIVAVNGQFCALLLPIAAERDFIAVGVPVREGE